MGNQSYLTLKNGGFEMIRQWQLPISIIFLRKDKKMKKIYAFLYVVLCLGICAIPLHAQWVQTNGAVDYQIFCLAENGKNLFAGSFGGRVFLSTNDGKNWSSASNNLNGNVYSLAVLDGNVFAGTDNYVFKTIDNGSGWSQIYNGLASNWSVALYVHGSNLYAAGSAGVYVLKNTGSDWTRINDPWGELQHVVINNMIIISKSGGGNPYIFVGSEKGIYRSDNNGQSWSAVNSGLTELTINAFEFIPDNSGAGNLFVGTNGGGGVFRSTDYGLSWKQVNNGLGIKPNMAVYAFAHNGSDLFVSTGGGVFLSKNYGENWFHIDEGFDATARSLLVTSSLKLVAGTLFYGIWSRPLSEMTSRKDFPENGSLQNFSLEQNYPNPFNRNTKISWQSPVSGWQTLKIYDILGNQVATLADEYKPAGKYEIDFNPGSGMPNPSPGIYYYQLKAGSFIQTKKMVITK